MVPIRGSDIVSDELTQIQAKGNVSITAAENYSSADSKREVKKSGFTASLSDGVASVGYGKSSLNTQNNGQSTTLTQSVIHSQQGDTAIIAGKDLTAQATILNAGKDLNLQGANVNLTAAHETTDQHSEMQSKNSGISVGITYSPAAAAVSAYQKNTKDSQFTDSAVGQVMAQGDALAKAGMAAYTPVVLTASNQKTSRTQDSSSSQAVVTQVSAKGNLNIIATEGNINSQGAQLSAEGDTLLHAKDTINLSFATDHQDQTASSKTKGFSVDNRDWSAPAGTYNNKNNGQAQQDKVTGTQLSVGGKTTLQTEKGDINILGSSVAGQGDVNINAARDVNIKSTQNSQSQSETSTNKGIGSAQISDTEKFYGYMSGKNQSNSQSVEQQRSQVGSLGGSVNIHAGNNYNQQVADVVANKDVNITAKQIKVLDDHNTSSSNQSSKDLKVGQFSRVSSPILDAIGAVDKAANSKADDRTQALQTLAAGAQAYQTYSDIQGGALFKAESGIGFSTSKNKQDNSSSISQQNNITAGGNVNLTSTEGDIHLQNTKVKAKDAINLDSAQHIVLESGHSQEKAEGKNSNAGLSVGVGASVGAQTGAYIYAEVGVGKGSNQSNSTAYNQTTLESDRLNIKSKGDTTLTGAKATANRIDADVGGKLRIESLQDQAEQNIKQSSAGGRFQGGYGNVWNASANFSQSKADGHSSSVDQQSGLFAGDGGYHVKADSVDLKGGAIVSTATKDKNDLTTNSFTFSNIENESKYDTTTVSLSGGTKLGKANGDGSAGKPTSNDNWRDATSFSPSLPQHKSDKDSSTTYATLSDGNITIGGKKTTVEQLGIHTDINTANNKVDTLPNLQEILNNQKTVADATSTIVAASRTYAQNQIKQTTAEKESIKKDLEALLSPEERERFKNRPAEEKEKYYSNSADYVAAVEKERITTEKWGIGGGSSRALNAVTTAITAALGGQTDLQVVTNSLSPYAAQLIGQQWGHGEDKNTAAQLAAHAILGATLAYVNGGNPAAGGSAAVAAEATAEYLSQQHNDGKTAINPKTGQFDANLLPEDVKASIRDLTSAIGAVVGGTVGDSTFNAQIAGVVGQNAVENNVDGRVEREAGKVAMKNAMDQHCATAGFAVGSSACGAYLRKEGFEILQGTAEFFLPTEPYELIPFGKGVAVVIKGTKKLKAVYKNAKEAQEAVKKSGAKVENNIHRDDDLWSRQAVWKKELDRLDKQAENVSTAKKGVQVTVPRDLNEQITWNIVKMNPGVGRPLPGMNANPLTGKSDPRFPANYGFQKMEYVHTLPNGQKITIHYQYNRHTNKSYDMKITTPQTKPSWSK